VQLVGLPAKVEGRGEGISQRDGDGEGVVVAPGLDHDGEHVSGDTARDGVAGGGPEASGDLREQSVTRGEAVRLVDEIEVVDAERDHGDHAAAFAPALECFGDGALHGRRVGEPGQPVLALRRRAVKQRRDRGGELVEDRQIVVAPGSRSDVCHAQPPRGAPSGVRAGTPMYAAMPRFRTARLSRTRGCAAASPTTSAASSRTTCWQKECDRGVSRAPYHGSGRPCALMKDCRCVSTSG
jgi:hypothetical protein